ncbi:hypothetical protein NE237_003963 [Protea cynaroides]|uniref:Uncharacterized protein n=1 Tax=Protea cynaroides TaxID=273540 RepID=A0A9Q0KI16_9MAGN|nr:hypothetical protein NE237_003963 [Protea cynaroides]
MVDGSVLALVRDGEVLPVGGDLDQGIGGFQKTMPDPLSHVRRSILQESSGAITTVSSQAMRTAPAHSVHGVRDHVMGRGSDFNGFNDHWKTRSGLDGVMKKFSLNDVFDKGIYPKPVNNNYNNNSKININPNSSSSNKGKGVNNNNKKEEDFEVKGGKNSNNSKKKIRLTIGGRKRDNVRGKKKEVSGI